MAYRRSSAPNIEEQIREKVKKFVRYEEGAKLYSMGLHSFQALAKDAGAIYRIRKVVLVNTEIIDDYLENFRET